MGSFRYDGRIQKIAAEKGPREAFDQIMADTDRYGSQLDDFSSAEAEHFNALASSLVDEIGSVGEEMHYFRNKLNRAPGTLDELIRFNQGKPEDQQWKLLDPKDAGYHMNRENGEYNVKFISPDGHFEAIYNKDGVLLTAENDPENMGTYNYFGPENAVAHLAYDVNPYIEWGNTKDVPSKGILENSEAIQNMIIFWSNLDAVKTYFDILKRTNPEVYQRMIEYYESKSY